MKTTHKTNNKKNISSICNQLLQLLSHKTVLSLSLLVLVTLVTHWRWIFLYKYFGWGDSSFLITFNETWRDHFSPPSLWSTRMNGLGGLEIVLSSYPVRYLLFGGLATFGLDVRIVAKLLYFIPVPLLSAAGSYFLIKHVLKNNLAGIVGAIVYSYNVYSLLSQAGTITLSAGYALAPLILYFLLKALETRRGIFLVLAGLTGFIESAYEFRFFYIIAWVMVFLILYYTLFIEKFRNIFRVIKNLIYSSIPFIIVFFLNLYWILPFYKTGSITSNVYFDRGLFGNQFMNWQQAVTFFHPFWTDGRGAALFVVQPIPIYMWLIPLFALGGLILNRKNKLVVFFAFVSVLGILLTKQSDHPFPGLYLWLYNNFPGFNAYREASKFYLLTALGYSVLIGAFVGGIQVKKVKNKMLIFGKYLAIALIAGLFLWNSRLLITGKMEGLFSFKDRPDQYEDLKNFLKADGRYYATFWVPQFSLWSFYSNEHPRVNLYNSYFNMWGDDFNKMGKYKFSENKSQTIADINHKPLDLFTQDYSDNFLDTLSVKYVIVPARDNKNDDDVFANTGLNDREYIVNFLNKTPYLKKLNNSSPAIDIYENSDLKPLIYLTEEKEDVFRKIKSFPVIYQYVNPTEYSIEIENINKPIYLNFNNFYAKGWGLDLGDGHYLPDKDHLQTNLKFNAFYIDPAEIAKKYDKKFYIENMDGSISLKLRLYYRPQDLVNIGAYISLVSFILIFIYLFMYLLKMVYVRFRK